MTEPSLRVISAIALVAVAMTSAGCSDEPQAGHLDGGPDAVALDGGGTPDGGPDAGGGGGDLCASGALTHASWRDLGEVPGVHVAGGVVAVGDKVLVATDDGIWARPVHESVAWARSGLDGKPVRSLLVPRPEQGFVLAGLDYDATGVHEPPIFVSVDGGKTWAQHGEELAIEPSAYEWVAQFTWTDGPGETRTFVANTSGGTIARSTDEGASWEYIVGVPGAIGYPCFSHIAPAEPTRLLQGCELPFDDAWVATYDLSATSIEPTFTKIVDVDDISNRRPNILVGFPSLPRTTFAGLEGGLIRIDGDDFKWIYRNDEPTDRLRYTYISAVWIDPCDARHVVFGGSENSPDGNEFLEVYETFDEGSSVAPVDAPEIESNVFKVASGVPVGSQGEHFAMAVVLGANETVHLIVREHSK